MSYRIVTDATADLDAPLLQGLPPLAIIPMDVLIGEDSYTYGPGGDLTIEAFYDRQRKGSFAKTSQITPDRFVTYLRPLLAEGLDVLYLGFASVLSGTFQSSLIAKGMLAEEFPECNIICIDTLCASAGMGFLILEALRRQQEGATLSDVASFVEEKRTQVCHFFTVDTFDHLKHGGRVSGAAAAIGNVLQIKPLLRVDDAGALDVVAKPRGRNQAIRLKLSYMEEKWQPEEGAFVLVAHGDCKEEALRFQEEIRARFPSADIGVTRIGPVIGSHTGPGMLAVLFWGSAR